MTDFRGTKFFYKNGTEFYVVGIAYQPAIGNGTNEDSTGGFVDPLGNLAGCKRDIPLLQKLGANVIRTYAIDTTLDHSGCIQAFSDAGISLDHNCLTLSRYLYHFRSFCPW